MDTKKSGNTKKDNFLGAPRIGDSCGFLAFIFEERDKKNEDN
jgi:hypothetical protein